jgi:predicted HicB family RNase H-like nuclease
MKKVEAEKFKGDISLRIPPEVHRDLAVRSRGKGVSLNELILSKLFGA